MPSLASRSAAFSLATLIVLVVAGPRDRASAQDVERVLEILRGIPPDFPERARELRRESATSIEKAEEKESAVASELPWFYLRQDEGVVRGVVKEETLGLRTPYGKLKIPVEELVEVRFFVRPSKETRQRVAARIADLGADDFEVRDAASKALQELFPESIPALREAARTPTDDEEVRLRVEALLTTAEEFLQSESETGDSPLLDGRDRVVAETFTLEGVIDVPGFEVTTPYGELRLSRRDLVRIVFRAAGSRRASVTVLAGNVAPTNWLSTRIEVRRGDTVEIQADGTLQVPSWGEVSGPEGGRRASRILPGFRMLALVGKIGESGAPFLVGREYRARARRAGKLYLGIVPFRYDTPVGSYNATIEVE